MHAVADEYRGAIAKMCGPRCPDPATAMAIAPARATATLRRMLAHGVRLLFGSDTPANVGIGNPPGLNGRLEMQRWFEARVSLAMIRRAATLDNAAAFGLSDQLGSIEVGNERTCWRDLQTIGARIGFTRLRSQSRLAICLVALAGQDDCQ